MFLNNNLEKNNKDVICFYYTISESNQFSF